MRDPRACWCDERTIDYSEVEVGRLVCTECGRVWYLTGSGWQPDPLTRSAPR